MRLRKVRAASGRVSRAALSYAGALLVTIVPVVPSTDRDYIGRVFAITVLGFDTVRAIAAATAAGITDDHGTLPDGFWSHAASVAVACSLVAVVWATLVWSACVCPRTTASIVKSVGFHSSVYLTCTRRATTCWTASSSAGR